MPPQPTGISQAQAIEALSADLEALRLGDGALLGQIRDVIGNLRELAQLLSSEDVRAIIAAVKEVIALFRSLAPAKNDDGTTAQALDPGTIGLIVGIVLPILRGIAAAIAARREAKQLAGIEPV